MPLWSVILAGGSGTRFWPASRRARPKQLLALGGVEQSLLALTVERIAPLSPPERILIATGAHLLDATAKALPGLGASSFLGEPVPRNTAPCIGWAASIVARSDPDGVVAVLPSDHLVADANGFRAALGRAAAAAEHGAIATIGIVPTRPETGYGYIEAGEAFGGVDGARSVARFVEKPDRAHAEQYLAHGSFFWNAGMFIFRARTMLDAIRAHLPELAAGLAAIDAAARRGADAERDETARVFPSLPSVSIDYGVMEKASPLAVVPASFGWSDLGSWESAWELAPKDADGNAAPAGAVLVDASGNLVHDLRTGAGKRALALAGVRDLCVVVTDDAVLVIPRERSQDVRAVVDALSKRGDTDLT